MKAASLDQIKSLIEALAPEEQSVLAGWIVNRYAKRPSPQVPSGADLLDRLKAEMKDGLFD